MKHIEQYIAKLDEEIHKHIKAELESDLLFENEQALHILFENRKHAIEMCREYKAYEHAAAPVADI